jgi:hypothetical protein
VKLLDGPKAADEVKIAVNEIEGEGDCEIDGDALLTHVRGGSASESKFPMGRGNGTDRPAHADRFLPNLNVSPQLTLFTTALFISEWRCDGLTILIGEIDEKQHFESIETCPESATLTETIALIPVNADLPIFNKLVS